MSRWAEVYDAEIAGVSWATREVEEYLKKTEAPLKSGDTVLGIGTGTIFLFGLQIAVASSTTVIATSSSNNQLAVVQKLDTGVEGYVIIALNVTEVIYLNKALALLDTGVSASDRRLVVVRCLFASMSVFFPREPFGPFTDADPTNTNILRDMATQIVTLVVGFILIYFESTILQLSKIDQTELTVLDGRWTILLRDTEGPVCRVLRYLSTSKPASARTTPMVLG
ncbi:uncharacterized protein B0H18DRAFT_1120594 [Fomitopsis serialis]|uniref:uncharacterized protein n=1 Tax=Fomitopsis serialis TaxID=139415 RepID=UPI00200895E2|nr:uncharacterized protein B0H18DRAFT_1120594 [Neoantrodia serialis]KAH9923070.1 hypothetical protein B0H18DRAFT_1120594 [Neoantrodia serialis]